MEWTIAIHKEEEYAEIITSGIADIPGSLQMSKAIAEAMGGNGIKKALIDQRNIDAVSGGLGEVYHRPKQLEKMGVVYGLSLAEVIKPEHKEFFGFLETVFVNRGFRFAIFDDREAAINWLLKK